MPQTDLRLTDWLADTFLPLWTLVLVLQLLDVGSVMLGYATGGPIREANPVLLALVARVGLVPALLVKLGAVAAWLALLLGVWLLCAQRGWRVGTSICTLLVAAVALYSAWVFWANVAAVFFGR